MTPYSNIYDRFLQKITDYTFAKREQSEIEIDLEGYLNSAISNFKRCKKDLSLRDSTLKSFTIDLFDDEQEIISILMVVEYLSPKLNDAKILKQQLSNSDYKTYSQANQIAAIKSIRDGYQSEVERKIIRYTYDNSDFSKLNQ